MDIEKLVVELSNSVSAGEISLADNICAEYLGKYCAVKRLRDGTVCGIFDKGADKTLLLEAHIDEIAFIVTAVTDEGFLYVQKVGGADARILPAQRVTVFGNNRYSGTFCSVPPHLSKGEKKPKPVDELCIDCGLGKKAVSCVPVGSLVFFDNSAEMLKCGRIVGKSLDNRAGVAALLTAAKYIAENKPQCNVVIALTKSEELGYRGAITAAFSLKPDFAVVVDTTFGDLPSISPTLTGNLGKGPLIGRSPVLSRTLTDALIDTACDTGADFQYEIMGGKTGTNADAVSISGEGIPTALISIPIRNMHTPCEIADIGDIEVCAKIIAHFAVSGVLPC